MFRTWKRNSPVHLLDGNILIALATAWLQSGFRFARCPITQGTLIRFHMRLSLRPSMDAAVRIISAICAMPNHEFWADDIPYTTLSPRGIIGYRKVTDAYLAALAASRVALLATMDEGLAAIHPSARLI